MFWHYIAITQLPTVVHQIYFDKQDNHRTSYDITDVEL